MVNVRVQQNFTGNKVTANEIAENVYTSSCRDLPTKTVLFALARLYQTHLKKLERIREERKGQLTFDSQRLALHEEVKTSKSRSFAHKYNEQHSGIASENVKLLEKLQKAKPFTRYSSFSTYQKDDALDRTSLTPFRRRRIEQTEKENSRIFVKVKSASSNLSKEKFLKDYAKSQQIKQRISRFATQNNRVCLKSQKLVNISQEKSLTAHYNPQQILKNKIENPLSRRKHNQTQRKQQNQVENELFPTEPKQRIRQRIASKRLQF